MGKEATAETKAANLHIQQPIKPVDDITRYGFYRATICINPGQTALIFNSKNAEMALALINLQYSDILNHRETQIIKN